MRLKTYLIGWAGLLVPFFLCTFAVCAQETTDSFLQDWGIRARYDQRVSYWFSADDDDGDEEMVNALDFKPELIPTQIIQGDILFRNASMFKLYYESPTGENNTDQDELLEISDKKSAMKKVATALDLFFIRQESTQPLVRFLSSMRFDYRKHQFFGKAEVQEPTRFIASDSTTTDLVPGDNIRFKTDFEEISLTWRVSEINHVGIYQAKTKKFHESSVLTANVAVYETEITGTGLKWILESEQAQVDMNLGFVKFRGDQGNFRSDGGEFMIHGEWRPHIYLIGGPDSSSRSRLAIVPSLGLQFTMQLGGDPEGVESDGSGESSMDIIADAGIGMIYQF